MEYVKISKTFHYRKEGEWHTVQAGEVIDKCEVPVVKLEVAGFEVTTETPKSVTVVGEAEPEPEEVPVEKKPKKKKSSKKKKFFGEK